jgi:hypothetical protein
MLLGNPLTYIWFSLRIVHFTRTGTVFETPMQFDFMGNAGRRSNESFRHTAPLPLLALSSRPVFNYQDKKGCVWLELTADRLNLLSGGSNFHKFHAFWATFLLFCFNEVVLISTCMAYRHSTHQACASMWLCPHGPSFYNEIYIIILLTLYMSTMQCPHLLLVKLSCDEKFVKHNDRHN